VKDLLEKMFCRIVNLANFHLFPMQPHRRKEIRPRRKIHTLTHVVFPGIVDIVGRASCQNAGKSFSR
jgi:hypothetical protein